MKKVVNKTFAKGKGEYEKVISTIEKRGKCPFCPDNFKYHKEPILKKENGWLLTKNSWPYKNTKYHFVIIGEKHKENFNELTNGDFKSVKILVNWALKKFNVKGGALSVRFGDTDHTGATVCHLHFHLISPKLNKQKKAQTVYFPIG
ncbi:MAG: HIT domain-containing protein [Candidatus Paceibacterota bacterium]|jgi:diadenosine tetraphosphate (Ap4A) HIT family hydrolase